ncbi:MAG: T9SS type A sorting domain-containing protein [Bacteroidota bacterium]
MKKIFTLFLALGFAGIVNAQSIPNGDFETWTDSVTCETWNFPMLGAFMGGSQGRSSDAHGGSYAMKISSTAGMLGSASAGSATIGTPGLLGGSTGGLPISGNPISFGGFYKYNSASSDVCNISIVLTKWNGTSIDTVGKGEFTANTTNTTYAPFLITLTGLVGTADTCNITMTSSKATAQAGSELIVDDLVLIGATITAGGGSSFIGSIDNSHLVNLYPNPSTGTLNVEKMINETAKLSIYNAEGRMVYSSDLVSNNEQINLSDLAKGSYIAVIQGKSERIMKNFVIM